MKKITNKLLIQMQQLRTQGNTYKQIQDQLTVSKAQCIKYLSAIKIDNESAISNLWKLAENEAKEILEKNGFQFVTNLNSINPSCYWDYLAIKNNERWLIDVTISYQKSPVEKQERLPEGFKGAILLKDKNSWKMWEILFKEMNINGGEKIGYNKT